MLVGVFLLNFYWILEKNSIQCFYYFQVVNIFGFKEDFENDPCHCVCNSATHDSLANSSSAWVLATLSILINIYLGWYIYNKSQGSKQDKPRELGYSIRNENDLDSSQEPSKNARSVEAIESNQDQTNFEIDTGNHQNHPTQESV